MQKFKKIAYIFLGVIITVIAFTIFSNAAKTNNTDVREKTLSEIQYFESKIVYMFNALNNIEFSNYKISVEDISEKSKKSSESSSGAGNGSDDSSSQSSDSSSSGDSSSSSSEGSSSSSGNESSLDNTKKYSLEMKGVLNSKDKINWDYIKSEAELLQNSISTMTLDLYEISLNNNDILNFSSEYDNLLIQIKKEDKQKTLNELTKLYAYIPKFIKNCNKNEQYEIIVNTKLNIFNAYSILDSEDWDTMNKHLQMANNKFSKLLTDINLKNDNQYLINKCYISLNALQNSIEKKDKEVFLIKYKNVLEDLNNI